MCLMVVIVSLLVCLVWLRPQGLRAFTEDGGSAPG